MWVPGTVGGLHGGWKGSGRGQSAGGHLTMLCQALSKHYGTKILAIGQHCLAHLVDEKTEVWNGSIWCLSSQVWSLSLGGIWTQVRLHPSPLAVWHECFSSTPLTTG